MHIVFNINPKLFGGGGFHFIRSFSESASSLGHTIGYDLSKKPDTIILVGQDAKANFQFDDVTKMKSKYDTKVILRINNLDTHAKKGSISHYKKYSKLADSVVYMSDWASKYGKERYNLSFKKEYIIHNIPLSLFYSSVPEAWDHKSPLKIVTHHWSVNKYKGFNFYEKIGRSVAKSKELRKLFHFCYIGRSPKKITGFVMKPFLRGKKLIDKLSAQHAYLTASALEVGPNHVAEGLAIGLPVLYAPNGGAVSEYVGNCGFEINYEKPIPSLISMREQYDNYYKIVQSRKKEYDLSKLCSQYLATL